ncbi:DUF952 domain-containing protein [Sphingomonas crusticola]|uniref:DUF952 domain-containing protein n=1 Tax=Sphingomonas crusticola TaxID=1697973 RepID=UPI000E24CC85|nr:DUF952 domain-containing protein [Sphingomonas crusticola]
MPESIAYKVLTADQLSMLEHSGTFAGAPVDLADGYIHLSSAEQLAETVAKHFAGQDDLQLVAVDLEALGEAVKWEESRGGALFPHLYGPLTLDVVVAYSALEYEPDGSVRLPVTG